MRRTCGAQKSERSDADRDADQPAIFREVAKRHDQKQAGAITDLRHGHDQPCGMQRQAERRTDRTDKRLRVVDVCGNQPAGHSKEECQAS